MIPREGRTPVGQNTHQAPGGNVSAHLILRQVGKSKSCEGGVQPQSNVIEDKLSFDVHLDLAVVLLEFPGVEATVRRQAEVNALVSRQVAGRLRSLSSFKVGSGPYDRHAKVRSDSNRDHVLRYLFTQPHAGVVAIGDDIREAVVNSDFNLDVGIVRENLRECRPERCVRRVLARSDAHGAGGLVAKLAQGGHLGFDLRESGPDRMVKPLARLGWRDASGGTRHQAQS